MTSEMREMQMLMPDIRGHGASGKDGRPDSFSQFAADMAGLLDQLGVDLVAVVGHAMDGEEA